MAIFITSCKNLHEERKVSHARAKECYGVLLAAVAASAVPVLHEELAHLVHALFVVLAPFRVQHIHPRSLRQRVFVRLIEASATGKSRIASISG
jgi:hypothetical protein